MQWVSEMRRDTGMPKRMTMAAGRSLMYGALAYLLGRANIAHAVSPFAFAYFVMLVELAGVKRSWPAWLAVLGSLSESGTYPAAMLAITFLAYRVIRRVIYRKKSPDLHVVPFIAGSLDVLIRMLAVGTVWTRYDVMLALADGALVVILSLIFVQCLPVLLGRESNKTLRSEQLISLTILTGSVLSGFVGVDWSGISLLRVCVEAVVLLMATAGGVGIGATVGVVMGVLSMLTHTFSLGDVAILSFAGLLSGMLKDAGRFWIGLAFAVSVSIFDVTSRNNWNDVKSGILAVVIAVGLYWLTTKKVHALLASYVPGTDEHKLSEQERMRRVQDHLSEKVAQLSGVFDELSIIFADTGDNQLNSARQLVDYAVGSAAQSVCAGCARQAKCWEKEGMATYQSIVNTVAKLEASQNPQQTPPTEDLRDRCCRIDPMMGVLRHNLEIIHRDARWIAKIREQRALVSSQLSGISNVIRSVSGHLDQENESSRAGEQQILDALDKLGLYVDDVNIISLEPGKVEIEVTQPSKGAYENSVRMIAPLLSGIVDENISVTEVQNPELGPCRSIFSSARLFNVNTGVATVARDGRLVSGDTYTSMDIGDGRYAVAVSDGMGNGERARRESSAAIDLLRKLLKAGFDEKLAIKTVNSTLLLRSREEIFTTLDMVLIDLYSAKAEFLKIGSAPSFIKRNGSVQTITGANVPIGILQDIEVQSLEDQLCEGDILILVSDGVYDAPNVYDKDDWLRRQIELIETRDPQAIADLLLEAATRMNHGDIHDDMTVMVAVVNRFQPEWAAIRVPGVVGIRSARDRKRKGA